MRKVTMTGAEVRAFARQWPGSKLEGVGGVTFEFASNGDLVDMYPTNRRHYTRLRKADGSALLALSQDAQEKPSMGKGGKSMDSKARRKTKRGGLLDVQWGGKLKQSDIDKVR